jgi:hypothetical protein
MLPPLVLGCFCELQVGDNYKTVWLHRYPYPPKATLAGAPNAAVSSAADGVVSLTSSVLCIVLTPAAVPLLLH